jgi:hypothetical protein
VNQGLRSGLRQKPGEVGSRWSRMSRPQVGTGRGRGPQLMTKC